MDYQLGPGPLQVDQNTIDEKIKGDIGIVENGDVATHAIPSGYYVIWKGDLYVAKTDISSGTTLSTSNLTAKPNGLGADVTTLNSNLGMVSFKKGSLPRNAAVSLNIPNGGRNIIFFVDSTSTRQAAYMVAGTGSGGIVFKEFASGSEITVSTAPNTFTVSKPENSTPMYLIINLQGEMPTIS